MGGQVKPAPEAFENETEDCRYNGYSGHGAGALGIRGCRLAEENSIAGEMRRSRRFLIMPVRVIPGKPLARWPFTAQAYKAVLLSADHLAARGLLKDYGDRRMEVFCLVADEFHIRNYP
jgi:hypothetical protein